MKPTFLIIGITLTSLFSACTPPPAVTSEKTQIQSVTPISSQTPTIKYTEEPTIEPTAGPSIVRPESGIKTAFQYTQEQLDAFQSGKFQEGEDFMSGWLDYWLSGRLVTGEDLNFTAMPLTYIYLFDSGTLDNIIVALESPDYPNTAILPPIDFTKSKGLHVEFMESLPYEKDGHSIPSYLMPTFLTIDANEESVASGKMQERFIHTTFTNIGGEPVRINSEGKVVAKIGVKPETQEAKWVRELCTDYSNPDNYTPVTIEEIRSGQIQYDEEVQAEPFPEDVVFPAKFDLNVNIISGSVYGYDANNEPTTKFYRNAFFYMLDETLQEDNAKIWYMPIVSQQYLNKDRSWSFIIRDQGGWSGKDPNKYVENLAPNVAMLPTFYLPTKAYPQSFWEYYRKINNDDTFLSLGGAVEEFYKEYTVTGFIPKQLTKYIIPAYSYVKVKKVK